MVRRNIIKRYTVNYGANGTSKEFKSIDKARELAQKLAKTGRYKKWGVSVEELDISRKTGDWSQRTADPIVKGTVFSGKYYTSQKRK